MKTKDSPGAKAGDSTISGAQALVAQLAARGVKRIFGVPGGECSLDIIEAAQAAGIPFVLARTENSAAIMAGAAADLSGDLGVLLTTRGPGLANGVNGIAYAALDRTPLLVMADGNETDESYVSSQRFDQGALVAPLVKGRLRLEAAHALPALGPLLDLARTPPFGPVYVELTGAALRARLSSTAIPLQPIRHEPPVPPASSLAAARAALARARRPVIIAGLQAGNGPAAIALRELARRLHCPVLASYRGKGAIADSSPLAIGPYIGGVGEDPTLKSADLLLLYGLDPIEIPPKPWSYTAPIVELLTHPFDRNYFLPVASLVGDLGTSARSLLDALGKSDWTDAEIAAAKTHLRELALVDAGGPITPQQVIAAALAAMPAGSRVTVDSGAHMLGAMALCPAERPGDVMISRGLATMAFALPAAIGAAMAEPDRRVVALTGDGGLMMCAGELATAAQLGCRLTVVVFNDSALALIGVKQARREFGRAGVDFSATDFAAVATGFGCRGIRVEQFAGLAAAMQEALSFPGPSLVDVVIDPATYRAQVRALRG